MRRIDGGIQQVQNIDEPVVRIRERKQETIPFQKNFMLVRSTRA
jgi:hypothetical protein